MPAGSILEDVDNLNYLGSTTLCNGNGATEIQSPNQLYAERFLPFSEFIQRNQSRYEVQDPSVTGSHSTMAKPGPAQKSLGQLLPAKTRSITSL